MVVVGIVVDKVVPNRSIVPGCAMADAAMLAVMVYVMDMIRPTATRAKLPYSFVVVADDLQVLLMGPMTRVVSAMADVHVAIIKALEVAMVPTEGDFWVVYSLKYDLR